MSKEPPASKSYTIIKQPTLRTQGTGLKRQTQRGLEFICVVVLLLGSRLIWSSAPKTDRYHPGRGLRLQNFLPVVHCPQVMR